MNVSTWTGLVPTPDGTYTVADPGPAWDEGLPRADESFTLAALNGFIGRGAPWAAYVITGTRSGPVRLTVEVHDSSPGDPGDRWTEVVESEFVSHSGTLHLIQWGGENIATLEGLLSPGPWGLRACARGRDEGHDRIGWMPNDEPLEEHLFQLWPGHHAASVVRTSDAIGATMRGELRS